MAGRRRHHVGVADRAPGIRRAAARGRARHRHRSRCGPTDRCRWWSCWSRCRPAYISSAGATTRSSRSAPGAGGPLGDGAALRGPPAPAASAGRTCATGDRSGLAAAETRHRAPRTVAVYPHLAPLRHLPRPCARRRSSGNYVSPAQGEGIEPGDIRSVRPRRSRPPRQLARHPAAGHAARDAASPGAQRRRRAVARHAVRTWVRAAARSWTSPCGRRPRWRRRISPGRIGSG